MYNGYTGNVHVHTTQLGICSTVNKILALTIRDLSLFIYSTDHFQLSQNGYTPLSFTCYMSPSPLQVLSEGMPHAGSPSAVHVYIL